MGNEALQRLRALCLEEHYFRPPYVGHRGWIGVCLDVPVDWSEIAGVISDAHETVARRRG